LAHVCRRMQRRRHTAEIACEVMASRGASIQT
jgi:hypothetical protein